jgi:hypothetical protein
MDAPADPATTFNEVYQALFADLTSQPASGAESAS